MSSKSITAHETPVRELDFAEFNQVCGGGSKLGSGTDGVHSVGSKPGGTTDGIVPFGSKPGAGGDGFF